MLLLDMTSVSDKARLLIKQGRVEILDASYHHLKAMVKGEHGKYQVEVMRDGRFNCGCDNFIYTDSTVECSHVLAVKMHQYYRDWWPLRKIDGSGTLEMNATLRESMPLFHLESKEIIPIRPRPIIDPEKAREFIDDGDDITKYVRKLRFVDNKTYEEIIEEVRKKFGLEVSQGYVYRRVTSNPDYTLSTGAMDNES
jgi:hypothetical protein